MEMEGYVLRAMKSVHNATARCSGCVSTIRGTARQAHTENGRKRIKGEFGGPLKAEAAQRCVNEYLDKAVERRRKARNRTGRKREWTCQQR